MRQHPAPAQRREERTREIVSSGPFRVVFRSLYSEVRDKDGVRFFDRVQSLLSCFCSFDAKMFIFCLHPTRFRPIVPRNGTEAVLFAVSGADWHVTRRLRLRTELPGDQVEWTRLLRQVRDVPRPVETQSVSAATPRFRRSGPISAANRFPEAKLEFPRNPGAAEGGWRPLRRPGSLELNDGEERCDGTHRVWTI